MRYRFKREHWAVLPATRLKPQSRSQSIRVDTHLTWQMPARGMCSLASRRSCYSSISHAGLAYRAFFERLPSPRGRWRRSEEGKQWLSVNGVRISRCKSDLVVTIQLDSIANISIGVSTKQCNNRRPTNAQLYFTTARGFSALLVNNGIPVTGVAIRALRQFCGDEGFRPSEPASVLEGRRTDPRRYFWEEIEQAGRGEWERMFSNWQDQITRLLLQKAYLDDPFVPEYLLHKTKRSARWGSTEIAIYSIEELIALSRSYQGFATRPYTVTKGSYKDPPGVIHLAPRFGVVQMQRGGQKQHPEQLQFNLEARYFYKLSSE